MEKGATCSLILIGSVPVETLTGGGAVQFAVNKLLNKNKVYIIFYTFFYKKLHFRKFQISGLEFLS
jgi:hypothetical protein